MDAKIAVISISLFVHSVFGFSQDIATTASLRCISVNVPGDVSLEWLVSIDTCSSFNQYMIYTSEFRGGPYIKLDSVLDYNQLDYQVIGVSADSVDSHKNFVEKYNLPFILLSDSNKDVINLYEVSGRDSFLIDKEGVIIKIYKKVNPKNHIEEVLNDIK